MGWGGGEGLKIWQGRVGKGPNLTNLVIENWDEDINLQGGAFLGFFNALVVA